MPSIQVLAWIIPAITSFIAGLVAVGASVAIEKLGGLLGGLLASTPTTVVPSCVGVSFLISPDNVFIFAMSVPPPLLVNSILLHLWKVFTGLLPKHWTFGAKLATLIVSILMVWFCLASFILLFIVKFLQVPIVTLAMSCIALHAILGFAIFFSGPPPAPKGSKPVSIWILLLRGTCACITVFCGTVISKSRPDLAGFVSCFPAIYLTTLISVYVSQGDKVVSGATGPMILGGLSVSLFAVFYGFVMPHLGIASSTILSYAVAVCGWSIPVALFIRWWNSRYPQPPPTENLASPASTEQPTTNSDPFPSKSFNHYHPNGLISNELKLEEMNKGVDDELSTDTTDSFDESVPSTAKSIESN